MEGRGNTIYCLGFLTLLKTCSVSQPDVQAIIPHFFHLQPGHITAFKKKYKQLLTGLILNMIFICAQVVDICAINHIFSSVMLMTYTN